MKIQKKQHTRLLQTYKIVKKERILQIYGPDCPRIEKQNINLPCYTNNQTCTIMELYYRLKNFITSWDINLDEVGDLVQTLRKESGTTLWCLQEKLNGCYELFFGFDKPFLIHSDAEREDLIKRIDEEYIHTKEKE